MYAKSGTNFLDPDISYEDTCLQFFAVKKTIISCPFRVVDSLLFPTFVAYEIKQLLVGDEGTHEVFASRAEVHTVAI